MKRNLRILRLYYYGRIKLAKRMKKARLQIRKERCRKYLERVVAMNKDELALEKAKSWERIRKLSNHGQ